MDEITTVGIDLAKEVFAVCILDARGAVVERKVLRRAAFERWAAALPPSTVAMEACGSAHHWGRTFAARGHTARLIAAEFVVPFRQGGKNDGNDALAIAIAARQPTMRFVPIKTVEQQAILSWHRMRQGWIEERTAVLNRIRGLLVWSAPARRRGCSRHCPSEHTDRRPRFDPRVADGGARSGADHRAAHRALRCGDWCARAHQ
jgi:transposase